MTDVRIQAVNKFTVGMMELKINRHPQRSSVTIVLCEVSRDHYSDTKSTPVEEVEKTIILIKNPNLEYINSQIGILQDDGDSIPWIGVMTLKGLTRTLRKGDYCKINDVVYKVSGVKPYNRDNREIIQFYLHPERDDFEAAVMNEFIPLG